MRLSVIAFSITAAVLWGGSILLIGLINLMVPSFGAGYLAAMSSLHPGFQASRTVLDVLVGTLAGAFDGAITGFLLAWVYNWLLARFGVEASPSKAAVPMM